MKHESQIKPVHRLHLTDSATDWLISQLKELAESHDRIVISVTSNAMIDEVWELLVSAGITSARKVKPYVYKTKSYLYLKHFKISYQYREDSPPWAYSGTESEHDLEQREQVEASDLWRLKLQNTVSDSVFRRGQQDEIKIVIMTNGVLFNSVRRWEMEEQDAKLIMFKPGINDFQNYYKKVTYKDKVREEEFIERPDGSRYPVLLQHLDVDYVLSSKLLADLIRSSYEQYRDGDLTETSTAGVDRNFDIRMLTSRLTSKRYSGTFPVVFNMMNKSSFGGSAVLIGDGMGSQHSFNRVRAEISMIDAPVVVKLSEPCPQMIESLGMQLKKPEQELKEVFQDTKKRIVTDYAESVLTRVNSEQEIYFVCDPKLPKWLGEDIPAFAKVKPVRVDDDGGNFRRLRLGREENPVAYMLHQSLVEVVKLTKSKRALWQWIKQNEVVGQNLEKVIVNLMVTVTIAIREGFAGMKPIPWFKLTENLDDRIVLKDRGYIRLVELIDSSIEKYFREESAYKSVYEQYCKSPYL